MAETVVIDDTILEQLQEAAHRAGRSVRGEVHVALRRHLGWEKLLVLGYPPTGRGNVDAHGDISPDPK